VRLISAPHLRHRSALAGPAALLSDVESGGSCFALAAIIASIHLLLHLLPRAPVSRCLLAPMRRAACSLPPAAPQIYKLAFAAVRSSLLP
jgi:hypothetical protein